MEGRLCLIESETRQLKTTVRDLQWEVDSLKEQVRWLQDSIADLEGKVE